MSSLTVSILLPAYNAEIFLRQAIDSLLHQTLTDFELLIVDDGSTDATFDIIQSYKDSRIIYIANEQNCGLIHTLNKGVSVAKGKYIARMDADDICLPERLQKQFDWLEEKRTITVVGCHVAYINEAGVTIGEWKDDMNTTTSAEIKSNMAWANCMAHPSVMVRAEVLKKYCFQNNQKHTEDYDLWLRLLADGYIIEKVPEKLLQYRIHSASITGSILRKSNPFLKQYNCKRRFLANRLRHGKWGMFETKVLFTMLHNGIMGMGKSIKSMR